MNHAPLIERPFLNTFHSNAVSTAASRNLTLLEWVAAELSFFMWILSFAPLLPDSSHEYRTSDRRRRGHALHGRLHTIDVGLQPGVAS